MTEELPSPHTAMDAAAAAAEAAMAGLPPEAVKTVAAWWAEHYPKAGHKRLGRLLAKVAKKT